MRGSSWTFYNISSELEFPICQDEDLSKLEEFSQMGFLNGGVIYRIYYYMNRLTIGLSPQYIAFNEPQAKQGSNDTDNEGHELILGIVNSNSDNAAQQLSNH